MKNARSVRSRISRRDPDIFRQPAKIRTGKKETGKMVCCVFAECEHGAIEECAGDHGNQLAVIRFTPGMVVDLKSGPLFKENLRFPDKSKYKFAHADCAWEAGLRLNSLSMDKCLLPGCGRYFQCSRDSSEVDVDGVYVPAKRPKWGCVPEGCLHVERGTVDWVKGGRFLKFTQIERGAVHWACARGVWKWELFQGLTPSFASELVHARSS